MRNEKLPKKKKQQNSTWRLHVVKLNLVCRLSHGLANVDSIVAKGKVRQSCRRAVDGEEKGSETRHLALGAQIKAFLLTKCMLRERRALRYPYQQNVYFIIRTAKAQSMRS
jgi:hypothetical protein